MSTHLEELPVELCAHVALFLDRHRHYSKRDNSLLALRSVSHACLDAVRRAIKNHPTNEVRFYGTTDTRQITTVGQILGSGCQRLEYQGKTNSPPSESDKLNAIQQIISVETGGRLQGLCLCGSTISAKRFLEICSACPQLKELDADWGLPNIAEADVDVFAAELSRLCPLLERVSIQRDELVSPGETYAMHFPNLKFLDLEVEKANGHVPSRFDKIEAAAHHCVGAEELGLTQCTVSAAFAERLLRTPLHSRIKSLYLDAAIISPQTILRFAAGLEVLREIVFPHDFSASPEFYMSLARARQSLKKLYFEDQSTLDDACVAALCENLKLEALDMDSNFTLTPAVVDIILQSPTAQTLSEASFSGTIAFDSAGILRLARNCPRLRNLTWCVSGLTPLGTAWPEGTQHGKNVDDLTALLKVRGRGHADCYFSVDPFKRFCPWVLAEARWRYSARAYPNQDA